jgi:hypothetical protein
MMLNVIFIESGKSALPAGNDDSIKDLYQGDSKYRSCPADGVDVLATDHEPRGYILFVLNYKVILMLSL